jgi:rod shape determining protein RodA
VGDQSIADCDRLRRLFGKGSKRRNTQVEQGFLPGTTVHTDYIYSAIAEQWGFLGGMVMLGAFRGAFAEHAIHRLHAADEIGLLMTIGFTRRSSFTSTRTSA